MTNPEEKRQAEQMHALAEQAGYETLTQHNPWHFRLGPAMSRVCYWLAAAGFLAVVGAMFTFRTDAGLWDVRNRPSVLLTVLSLVTWLSSALAGDLARLRAGRGPGRRPAGRNGTGQG